MSALQEYVDRFVFSGPDLEELAEVSKTVTPDWWPGGVSISKEEGALLGFLAKLIDAKTIVEIGTFTGYSAFWLAQSGGEIFTCDTSNTWTDIAKEYWEKFGIADRVKLFVGPGIEFIRDFPEEIDLSFIDADKENYLNYYEAILAKTRKNGLIILDDTLWFGEVVRFNSPFPEAELMRRLNAHIASDPRVESVLLNMRNGLTICRKKGS